MGLSRRARWDDELSEAGYDLAFLGRDPGTMPAGTTNTLTVAVPLTEHSQRTVTPKYDPCASTTQSGGTRSK